MSGPCSLKLTVCLLGSALMIAALGGCSPSASPVVAAPTIASLPPPFKVYASVQEIMEAIVDPSADAVWDSVGTTLTRKGAVDHQPHSDAEWKQVRLHAVALIEATNLLMMDGRHLVPAGGKIADEGEDGVLSTVEAEARLQSERATFLQFARALNDTGVQMLKNIDAKQPDAMMATGEAMDEVCESCHMRFWYPNQAVWKISKSAAPNSTK